MVYVLFKICFGNIDLGKFLEFGVEVIDEKMDVVFRLWLSRYNIDFFLLFIIYLCDVWLLIFVENDLNYYMKS